MTRHRDGRPASRALRQLRPWLVAWLVVLLAIQLVPYGRAPPDPPVDRAASWPSERAATRFSTRGRG